MRTTIVVEDGPGPALTAAASGPATPATPAEPPADAGGAPAAGPATAGPDRIDGGVPPSWLMDAIAAAGGITAPASPEGIELGGDAGAAPSG